MFPPLMTFRIHGAFLGLSGRKQEHDPREQYDDSLKISKHLSRSPLRSRSQSSFSPVQFYFPAK
jgi:hypothetical protein